MFRKPHKVKTNTTIKGSERRRLRSLVETLYPQLCTDDINTLIPNKGEMNQVKGMTHSGSVAMIYYTGNNPIFFQIHDVCYPTVYTLWKHPKLLPTVTSVPPVLDKIINGADLMAPGIVIDELTFSELKELKVKDVCAVRILGNMAPVAVGTALISAEQMSQDGVKGKAVSIVHSYRDSLWLSGNQQEPPLFMETKIEEISNEIEDVNISDETITDTLISKSLEATNNEIDCVKNDENIPIDEKNVNENNSVPEYTMDEILYNSFLTSIKVNGKKIKLPILTSVFYSTYVLKSCPSILNLDIKKTTYKKLSVFLKKMQKDGIIQIQALSEGVEHIISIHVENEIVASFRIDPLFKNHMKSEKEKSSEEAPLTNIQDHYKFPLITKLYVVNALVKGLFGIFQIKKDESFTAEGVRDILRRYIKENNLQRENPMMVTIDPILADCLLVRADHTDHETLCNALLNRMRIMYKIEFEGKEPIISKGNLKPIAVTVQTRAGNKKVTLIENLEVYGIDGAKLAHHVQVTVAASTSIVPTPSGRGTSVLIQGNQLKYLQKLFFEIYKVPRKYVQGLENVSSKKK